VPVVPGTEEPLGEDVPDATIKGIADRLGYPIMIKAVAGGGGKGMRLVVRASELPGAVRAARSEAKASFGDPAIYIERRLARPRHIEVQLLADEHGTVLPFVERECSIQRRHQKVIEETPSPAVGARLREAISSAAASVARSVGYTNAGTIEFLLDEDGSVFFLEMNTRLQVEHPITEMVTGIDLVQWQIRIARGERLDLDPASLLAPSGHAIECRIYAEDPDAGFLPSPGRITAMRVPGGPGIRDDSGTEAGADVSIFYDPMISKLVAWGETRAQAIARMRRALGEYEVLGIRTTVPFFAWMLDQPDFLAARVHTSYLDDVLGARQGQPFTPVDEELVDVAVIAAAIHDAGRLPTSLSERGREGTPAPPTVVGRVLLDPARANRATDPPGGWKTRARAEGLRS
jgi:acetyl-CoA carboxylase biotin carboxylase subunit